MSDTPRPGKRAGRRPGNPDVTRREILDASRVLFGELGFERATIRAIARRARVDPALILHHFGSKEELFVVAHELPFSPAEFVAAALEVDRSTLGETLARFYLVVLGAPGSPAVSLLRAAATNESAARMLREFIDDAMLTPVSVGLGVDRARLRVVLAGSHLIGLLFGRAILAIPELVEPDVEELVHLVAPTVQRYLTAPLPKMADVEGRISAGGLHVTAP